MKKLLSVILILSALLCMPSCNGSDTTGNGTKTDEPEQKTEYELALDMIEQGKYEDAYFSLRSLARKGDERAEEKLDDFKLVYEQEIYTTSDGDKLISDNTYDTNGNLIKTVSTYSDGYKYTPNEYTYDTDGNMIKQVYTDYDGDKYIYDYTYDTNGNRIKTVCTSRDGDKYIYDYTYDTNGNLIKLVITYSGGAKEIYDYTYNTNGNLIKEVYTESDGDKEIYDYTYDTNGNKIKEVITYSDGNTYTITTEYSGYRVFYRPKKK